MTNRVQVLAMTLLVSFIAGCGPDDYGEAQPDAKKSTNASAGAENGTRRTVPFITVRNKTGNNDATDFFGDERGPVHTGYCSLSRTPIEILKPLAEKAPFYIPDDIVELDVIRELSIEKFWREMKQSPNGRRPVLYTHGYYISFERGCKRASQFQESLGLAGRLLFFSWPSDGAILNYTQDESDLYWSVAPLRKTLTGMVRRFGAGGFDIAAHSLGTRGIFLALVQMSKTDRSSGPLINQLVLLAADIDAGIFRQYLPQFRPLVRYISIYVSANDKSLALSRQVHGYPRLGEAGAHLEGLPGVEIIDLSDLPVRYPSGHVYHLYHDVVASDLDQLLNGGKSASQRGNLKHTGENYWRLQPINNADKSS
jgi:esterase/lipase superfamily enzyme